MSRMFWTNAPASWEDTIVAIISEVVVHSDRRARLVLLSLPVDLSQVLLEMIFPDETILA